MSYTYPNPDVVSNLFWEYEVQFWFHEKVCHSENEELSHLGFCCLLFNPVPLPHPCRKWCCERGHSQFKPTPNTLPNIILNPLSPTSDLDRISPYTITTIYRRQVMRIKKNIN